MYPIPILSPFLFIPSLYASFLNSQDFLFTCQNIKLHNFLGPTLSNIIEFMNAMFIIINKDSPERERYISQTVQNFADDDVPPLK